MSLSRGAQYQSPWQPSDTHVKPDVSLDTAAQSRTDFGTTLDIITSYYNNTISEITPFRPSDAPFRMVCCSYFPASDEKVGHYTKQSTSY
jgi:hypothetical protein